MSVFSKQLREDRTKLGFTQTSFGEALGVSQDAVYYWETRNILPYALLLISIENVLGWPRGQSLKVIEQG